jgi:succinate dehydrogenase flavin-adding protein (antitoxin of CptAB toxin-antitoxin module)
MSKGAESDQSDRAHPPIAGQAGDLIGDRDRERLRWRSRRGLLELDLLFQAFLARELGGLNSRECAVLQQVLELPDNELLDYCFGRSEPDDPEMKALVRRIAR